MELLDKKSTEFDWHLDSEWYKLLSRQWDIKAAKRLLATREFDVFEASAKEVEEWAKWSLLAAGVAVPSSPPVETDHPIILAEVDNGDCVIIDGWHRVVQAKEAGESLYVAYLPLEDSLSVMEKIH